MAQNSDDEAMLPSNRSYRLRECLIETEGSHFARVRTFWIRSRTDSIGSLARAQRYIDGPEHSYRPNTKYIMAFKKVRSTDRFSTNCARLFDRAWHCVTFRDAQLRVDG